MSKRVPQRMCGGCREMKTKAELIRVVRSPEGEVFLDPVGKAPGRGAYVCRQAACLKRAVKARAFERAFKVAVRAEVFLALEEKLEEAGEEHQNSEST